MSNNINFQIEGFNQDKVKEKNNEDKDKMIQKREEFQVEVRKKNREEQLENKRKIFKKPGDQNQQNNQSPQANISSQAIGCNETDLKNHIDACLKITFKVEQFVELLQNIGTQDIFKQHYGVIGLRKILSVEDGPPIQMVIDANLVPKLIEFIKQEQHPHLQLEAAWALTNVASGSSHQTQTIIDKGGIPMFVKLLSSKHIEIAEQAIWALGNIAGDCAVYRDLILKFNGLEPLIKIIETTSNKNTVKHGTWALSNLCRGRPLPKFELVKNAIPTLAKVLISSQESEVLTDAAWALSYLSDGDNDRIDFVISTQVVPSLIKLLDHPYLSILIPSLRTLGNIVTGTDVQTNHVLDHGAIKQFYMLLNHEKRSVRRECCWTLSNITAGTPDQITKILMQIQFPIVEKLIQLITTDVVEIKREACWVLSNATSQGHPEDVKALVVQGVLKCFVETLKSEDIKTLIVSLEAIGNVLKKGKEHFMVNNVNPFVRVLDELQAVSLIENLQEHPNEDVYKKALKILENHFDLEDVL